MRKKAFTGIILVLLLIGTFSMVFNVEPATAGIQLPYDVIDIGPVLRESSLEISVESIPESLKMMQKSPVPYYEVGDIIYWLVYDAYVGRYFFDQFELRAIGNITEIWVQMNLSWPEGDPRPYPTILDEQIAYLLEEFETSIYPIDTEYFGTPDFHNGIYSKLVEWGYVPEDYYYEETGRNVILVSNIRDDQYYDPTYPYYIGGFYSPSFEYYFDRNIISIDCKEWELRMGPEGYEWIPGVPVTRPFLYESVIAHEYQHLIHDDYNPDDALFMNEGCSMYAEILCGYPIDWGSINSYLYTPDNSLTEWEDQGGINTLADYGSAMLWTVYLSDHFGGADFIRHFVQAGIPGIEGINAALAYFGFPVTFNDVYSDWRIANLIHADYPGRGRYNYVTIDLGSPEAVPIRLYEISGVPVPPTKGTDFGNTTTILGYDTGISMIGPYGSDYIMLNKWNKTGFIFFNGDDYSIVGWQIIEEEGNHVWWSGEGNLKDFFLVRKVDLTGVETATLTFDTYWDIEPLWDFGFVQVSTDGGATWTSLENPDTTYEHDPSAHPDIIAQLPGFTGWSEVWKSETFNLTAYAGQSILLAFRYMTDWAVCYPGWFIDNISIPEIDFLDDVEAGMGDWIVEYPENDFIVTVVYAKVIETRLGTLTICMPMGMPLLTKTEMGMMFQDLTEPSYVILIVSPTPPEDGGLTDYLFSATPTRG